MGVSYFHRVSHEEYGAEDVSDDDEILMDDGHYWNGFVTQPSGRATVAHPDIVYEASLRAARHLQRIVPTRFLRVKEDV